MTGDPMLRRHRALGDGSRLRILEELRSRGPLDSRQLGRLVGLHPNTVRSHVDLLVDAQLVRSATAPATGRGRPRVLYAAIADPAPEQHDGYRLLAQILAGYLASTGRPEALAESAGRAWGSHLAEKPKPFAAVSASEATATVVRLFAELGFMPEAVEEGDERRVLLHRCAFREVAESNQAVACSVHLGMLRGALAEMSAPLEAVELLPLVEPGLCVAHLRVLESGSPERDTTPAGATPSSASRRKAF